MDFPLWRFIKFTFGRKFPEVHVDANDCEMQWTIIKRNMSHKEYRKRFVRFNEYFKYRFLIPLIYVGRKILGRWVLKKEDMADEEQNKIMKIWDDAFELSIKEWVLFFRGHKAKDAENDYKKDFSIGMIRDVNDMLRTLYLHDTAYRTLFDMMMINMTIKMGEAYPGKIGTFLYRTKMIDDPMFKIITGASDKNTVLNMGTYFLCIPQGQLFRIDHMDLQKSLELNKQVTAAQAAEMAGNAQASPVKATV